MLHCGTTNDYVGTLKFAVMKSVSAYGQRRYFTRVTATNWYLSINRQIDMYPTRNNAFSEKLYPGYTLFEYVLAEPFPLLPSP